jgi:hypothetical protein
VHRQLAYCSCLHKRIAGTYCTVFHRNVEQPRTRFPLQPWVVRLDLHLSPLPNRLCAGACRTPCTPPLPPSLLVCCLLRCLLKGKMGLAQCWLVAALICAVAHTPPHLSPTNIAQESASSGASHRYTPAHCNCLELVCESMLAPLRSEVTFWCCP